MHLWNFLPLNIRTIEPSEYRAVTTYIIIPVTLEFPC
jgi:hypothetical protein